MATSHELDEMERIAGRKFPGLRSIVEAESTGVVPCPCDCKKLPEFHEADAVEVIRYLTSVPYTAEYGPSDPSLRPSISRIKSLNIEVHQTPEEADKEDPGDTLVTRILEGMNEEREHCDITHGDAVLTAKIALVHLKEDPQYYEKLKKAGLTSEHTPQQSKVIATESKYRYTGRDPYQLAIDRALREGNVKEASRIRAEMYRTRGEPKEEL